jgi:hypothetical protein
MNQTIELINVNKKRTLAIVEISRIVTTTYKIYLDADGVESYQEGASKDTVDMKKAIREIEITR